MIFFLEHKLYFFAILLVFSSCGINKNIIDSSSYDFPKQNFPTHLNNFELDYSKKSNWAFRSDLDNFHDLLPKNYNHNTDSLFDVSVFYIHPTTLYNSNHWNADTSYFQNNIAIDLCLENQASVFAGITELFAPHYREMHIHSYTDTINGYKAFEYAYNDVLKAFKYFIKNKKNEKFIIASHSQGTNHAKKIITDYLSEDESLSNSLILSYLIGMDISKGELPIPLCDDAEQLNCFVNWRSFNYLHLPSDWKYGSDLFSINPITFSSDSLWSNKKKHLGVLLPNQKIVFKKSLIVRNKLGLLWVKIPNNVFLNKYKSDSYHKADFNLFWMNIRQNLQHRLSLVFE